MNVFFLTNFLLFLYNLKTWSKNILLQEIKKTAQNCLFLFNYRSKNYSKIYWKVFYHDDIRWQIQMITNYHVIEKIRVKINDSPTSIPIFPVVLGSKFLKICFWNTITVLKQFRDVYIPYQNQYFFHKWHDFSLFNTLYGLEFRSKYY